MVVGNYDGLSDIGLFVAQWMNNIDEASRFGDACTELLRRGGIAANMAAMNAGLTVAFMLIVLWLRG